MCNPNCHRPARGMRGIFLMAFFRVTYFSININYASKAYELKILWKLGPMELVEMVL